VALKSSPHDFAQSSSASFAFHAEHITMDHAPTLPVDWSTIGTATRRAVLQVLRHWKGCTR
jgi:hypothetical protein